jgi:DNA primase
MELTSLKIDPYAHRGDEQQPSKLAEWKKYREENGRDFIMDEADRLMVTAADDPDIKEGVYRAIVEMVMEYPKSHQREYYIRLLGKRHKPLKNWKEEFKRQCDDREEEIDLSNAPDDDADTSTLERFGFYTQDDKYWFAAQQGFIEGTNFVIEPLFHIYSPTNNRRLIRITNEYGIKMLCDIPSDAMVSVDSFQKFLYSEGNFLIFVNNNLFKKLLRHIGEKFPKCFEIRTFGWQPEGFYAFADGSFNGKWQKVDEMGIVHHEGANYFSPAFSQVYCQLRTDDDVYENDRRFIYRESNITVKQWSEQLQRVFAYENNGQYGVAFLVAALFRSLIYNLYKIFPHLFLHGETGSGKSQLGLCMSAVFQHGSPPFNLNSGTDVAFFRYLGRYRDVVIWYDEYTDAISESRFQALKSAYDGAGRQKGVMSRDSRTESDKINSAAVISGQYLPQRDDNSLYNRSVVRFFVKPKMGYSIEETKHFNRLQEMGEEGLSQVVTTLINERKIVEAKFSRIFIEIFEQYKVELIEKGIVVQDRILRNYTILSTIVWLFQKETKVNIGINAEIFKERCLSDAIEQSSKISSTDALGTFWRIISGLIQEKELTHADYDIQEKWAETSVSKSGGEKQLNEIRFENKKRVLYLDFDRAYGKYMEQHRRVFGTPGLGIQTILDYSHNHWSYIGLKASHYFAEGAGKRTSAHMFDYGMLVDRQVLPEIQDATALELPLDNRYETVEKQEEKKLPF